MKKQTVLTDNYDRNDAVGQAETAVRKLRETYSPAQAFLDRCVEEELSCAEAASIALQLLLVLRRGYEALTMPYTVIIPDSEIWEQVDLADKYPYAQDDVTGGNDDISDDA